MPLSYRDPSGLIDGNGGGELPGTFGRPEKPVGPSEDEIRLKNACKGDPDCEDAVEEMIQLFHDTPRPIYLWPGNWPDRVKYGGGCITWSIKCQTKKIDDGCGRGISCKPVAKYYHGLHPFWKEHHWLEFSLGNGFTFCADDGTLGGTDHIFFDYDEEVFNDDPAELPWEYLY